MIDYKKNILVVIKIKFVLKYTEEEILEQLRSHYLKNPNMNSASFDKDKNTCSYVTLFNKFKSWEKALEAAGIPSKRITKEKILEQLREHYLKNSNITVKSFENDKNMCSPRTVEKKFGSWNKALLEAGIYIRENEKMSKEKILEQLKDHYSRNLKISVESFDKDKKVCNSSTVKNYFGNWEKALVEAGIREVNYVEYDKEKLLVILREKVKAGELRYETDIDKIRGIPSFSYIKKLWEWKDLTKKLGLKRVVGRYTEDEILKAYKKVKKKYKDEKISLPIMKKETGISAAVFVKHYRSWNNFLKSVDEEINKKMIIMYTDKELIEMYKDFSIKIGKAKHGATRKDVNSKGFVCSSAALVHRFTGFIKLRELAGFEPERTYPYTYSKDILKEILYNEYKIKGRRLTAREIREEWELPNIGTFYKHFKTSKITKIWEEVLKDRKL